MSVQAPVYTGIWTNHSLGPVQGLTLTLGLREGAYLIAFLTFYVTVTGSQFWALARFVGHQTSLWRTERDGLHIQHQLILRNNVTPFSALWELCRVTAKWRNIAKRLFLRSLPLLLLSAGTLIVFTVASIFASQVTKAAGTRVLINSPNCGTYDHTGGHLNGPTAAANFFDSDFGHVARQTYNSTTKATSYSRACYNSANDPLLCNVYSSPQIKFTTQNTTCPFAARACLDGVAPYQMDTGLIDSHESLGVNAKPEDRVKFRHLSTCAIIDPVPYGGTTNASNDDGLLEIFIGEAPPYNYTFIFDYHTSYTPTTYQIS
jgi:hypothetical protein